MSASPPELRGVFLCHSVRDAVFVLKVASYLRQTLDDVFCFEQCHLDNTDFVATINENLTRCRAMVVFVGAAFSSWQEMEVSPFVALLPREPERRMAVVLLTEGDEVPDLPEALATQSVAPRYSVDPADVDGACDCAHWITQALGVPWQATDDLPTNPHLFSYEKDIIDFYQQVACHRAELGSDVLRGGDVSDEVKRIIEKLMDGCPEKWPRVVRWSLDGAAPHALDVEAHGMHRDANVVAAALSKFHCPEGEGNGEAVCMSDLGLLFPEAGPRARLCYPRSPAHRLRVAVMVSGGIAPGINAVIDGIAQRHRVYAEHGGYQAALDMEGLYDGFRAFDRPPASRPLDCTETARNADSGGSMLGTSRVEKLIMPGTRQAHLNDIDTWLRVQGIDILYVIGGDGSMKAAHALWSTAQQNPVRRNANQPLSVVAIPKTMDNDILWVWQAFGFLSAVEKAREVIENLHTEVASNPRLGVLQLFGSDSGFVVSHAVLASGTGHCDVALIPETDFCMHALAAHMERQMSMRGSSIPFGLVVMAETAVPVEAMTYVEDPRLRRAVGLTDEEAAEIRAFTEMKKRGERIQGQTSDVLRNAGLKIVSQGLNEFLPETQLSGQPEWQHLRVFTNEPRHLIRAIRPSCSDVIIGQRLGTLAVDMAVAGYTDFMISQWLTEYVAVPLKLVVLGRKRIPRTGIFWKSVLAKTGQPDPLVCDECRQRYL